MSDGKGLPFENSELALADRVTDLLSRMTLDEKISFLPSRHPPIERLGLREFWLGGEGAHGVVLRDGGKATVFPQPLGISMTWDKELAHKIGECIADEARVYHDRYDRKGFLVLFFPTIDMERDPRWGRNEEAYGEDPFLAGKLASELIKGLQGDDEIQLKVAAMPKHFYANNYEFERTSADSVIGEKLKNEYYLRVFAYAFEEGHAKSLMCAYNKINGNIGLINPELNSIVRGRWGSDGFYATDGGAFGLAVTEHKFGTYAEAAAAALKAGLDAFLDKPELVIESVAEAVSQSLLSEEDIDATLSRQLPILFRLGVYGGDSNRFANVPESALCSEENSLLARKTAREAVVLLKNDGLLPLPKDTKKIAVVGRLGDENLPDWYSGNPPYSFTILDGIRKAFPDSEVEFADGCDITAFYSESDLAWARVGEDGNLVFDGTLETRTLFHTTDWGFNGFAFRDASTGKFLTTTLEGSVRADADEFWGWFLRELFFVKDGQINDGKFSEEKPHGSLSSVGVAMKKGVSVYDKPYAENAADSVNAVLGKITIKVVKDGLQEAKKVAENSDVAILALGNHPLVGARECIDRIDLEVPERWKQLAEAVQGVCENTILSLISGYPFALKPLEDLSKAVLFTAHGAQELGTAIGETLAGVNNPSGKLSQTWYATSEELPDINDYDIAKNKMTYMYCVRPTLHPFGFGLSYTSFKHSDLVLEALPGGAFKAGFSVTNTGEVPGETVGQLYFSYIHDENEPRKRLIGFERVYLAPGETKQIEIEVAAKEFLSFDEKTGSFEFIDRKRVFFAGASAEDLPLQAEF
ncbi:MAG: glycoside hydrolase family 3 C-terminal domain-containing protein [Clostridiales bacterium]|jgi:beta-glucosidase|nr:glycoside hydrolase family 3 C-terminal domain-containing protein [Clostridiales bacterium]